MACAKKTVVAFDVPLNVPAEAVWNALYNGGHCPCVATVPEIFASVEGRWLEEGGCVHMKFNNGLTDSKSSFELVDHVRRGVKWRSEEEGPLAMRSHDHNDTLYIAAAAAGPPGSCKSCIAQFRVEFDANAPSDFVQLLKDSYSRTMEILSSRINSQPSFN